MLRRYVSLLLGGGGPRDKTAPVSVFKFSRFLKAPAYDGASFLRGAGWDLLLGIKTPAGVILPGSPSLKRGKNPPDCCLRTSPLHRSKFSRVHPTPRSREPYKRYWQSIHMLNFTYEDDIKIKNKHVAEISRTFYLSTETISRPPQSRETIPLILLKQ
jgi:hypothetical protein